MKTSALLVFGFVLCAASAFSQTESEIRESNRGHVEAGFRRRHHERRDHSPISYLWTPR